MLKLDTPITIGSQTYDILLPGRGLWDLRGRSIEVMFVLAQEEPGRLRIAREVDGEQGPKILSPKPAAVFRLNDKGEDPVFNALLQNLTTALEALEQFYQSTLADMKYELGEDEVPLAATFESSTKEYQNEHPARSEPAPAEGESR